MEKITRLLSWFATLLVVAAAALSAAQRPAAGHPGAAAGQLKSDAAVAGQPSASSPESSGLHAGHGRALPVTSGITLNAFDRTWFVKDSGGQQWLPGPCVWSGNGGRVWSDGEGLHLTVQPQDAGCGGWASTEVWDTAPRGYGNYLFRISGAFNKMDPQTTFGLFTWDDDCPGDCHFREIDFEIGKWGNDGDPNSIQFVVQPFYADGNLRRASLQAAQNYGGQWGDVGGGNCIEAGPDNFGGAQWQKLTLFMQWFGGPPTRLLRFYVFNGHFDMGSVMGAAGSMIAGWQFPFPDRIPTPGDERIHLNMWQCNWGGVPGRGRRVHVVVNGYEFDPGWKDMDAAGIHVGTRRRLQASHLFPQAGQGIGGHDNIVPGSNKGPFSGAAHEDYFKFDAVPGHMKNRSLSMGDPALAAVISAARRMAASRSSEGAAGISGQSRPAAAAAGVGAHAHAPQDSMDQPTSRTLMSDAAAKAQAAFASSFGKADAGQGSINVGPGLTSTGYSQPAGHPGVALPPYRPFSRPAGAGAAAADTRKLQADSPYRSGSGAVWGMADTAPASGPTVAPAAAPGADGQPAAAPAAAGQVTPAPAAGGPTATPLPDNYDPQVIAPGPKAGTTSTGDGNNANRPLIVGVTVAGSFLVLMGLVAAAVVVGRRRMRDTQLEESLAASTPSHARKGGSTPQKKGKGRSYKTGGPVAPAGGRELHHAARTGQMTTTGQSPGERDTAPLAAGTTSHTRRRSQSTEYQQARGGLLSSSSTAADGRGRRGSLPSSFGIMPQGRPSLQTMDDGLE